MTNSRHLPWGGIFFALPRRINRSTFNFMKLSQLLPACLALICCAASLSAQTSGCAFAIDSVTAAPGQVVCVPVKTIGFEDMVSFQFSMEFDENVVAFDHAENFQIPDYDETSFNVYTSQCLLTGWASETGFPVSRQDGTTLVDLCFKVISSAGTGSDLNLTSCFPVGNGSNEAYNISIQNVWTPTLFVNGRIDIASQPSLATNSPKNIQAGVKLFPNPTASGASVQFRAIQSDAGAIRVTNLYGNTVWEQAIAIEAGENVFSIPGATLGSTGMYQVTITSGREVLTQLLSTF